MTDVDHLLDEIVAQIREQEVPTFPRESMAARFDTLKVRYTDSGSVFPKFSRMRLWQSIAAGAFGIGLMVCAVWLVSGIGGGKALAFADVKEAVGATQTMSYRILHFSNDPGYLQEYNVKPGEPAVSQVVCSGDRVRNEQPLGVVTITDYQKRVMMAIWHSQGLALIEPIYGTEWIKKSADFRAKLRNIPESGAKKLPEKNVNGRPVSKFLVRMGDRDFTVTVDPKTKLPIRMEVVYAKQPERGQGEMREVYTDFVFDAAVDDSLFRMEPPVGYKVKNHVPRNDRPQPPETMMLTVSPEDGIGPVKLGTEVADVVRLLGEPDWRDEEEDFGLVSSPESKPSPTAIKTMRTELGYDRRGFRLLANDGGVYAIDCFKERTGGSGEMGFRGKTKDGIALDASVDDVIKTYGKPDAQMDTMLWYQKRGYRFEFRDKKLVSIHVGPPNPNVEIEVQGDMLIERAVAPK